MSVRSRSCRRLSSAPAASRPNTCRLVLEELEPRTLLAVTFTQTNLVSDLPGLAQKTDPNLVNPWGMTLGTNSGLWVSDNGAGVGTTYDATGQSLQSAVTIPAPGGTGTSRPTGVSVTCRSSPLPKPWKSFS